MQFVHREDEEYFRELICYAAAHNSKRNSWQLYPCVRRMFRERDAHHQDTVQLVMQSNMPDPYTAHTAWHICRTTNVQPRELVDSQHMFRLVVKFTPAHTEVQSPLMAFIYHMQTDPDCRFTRPLERFYYIYVHDWMARCETPAEVVRLLDAIQRNAPSIIDEHDRRSDAYMLYIHWDAMLRKKWLENDAPRKQYVLRAMQRLSQGWGDCIRLAE